MFESMVNMVNNNAANNNEIVNNNTIKTEPPVGYDDLSYEVPQNSGGGTIISETDVPHAIKTEDSVDQLVQFPAKLESQESEECMRPFTLNMRGSSADEEEVFDEVQLTDDERHTLEEEINEYNKNLKNENRKESLIDISSSEAQEQPGIERILESVCFIKWKETSGDSFVGTGFLAKITLSQRAYIGYFTAGHCMMENSNQLVDFDQVHLHFKHIKNLTKKLTLSKLFNYKKRFFNSRAKNNYILVCADTQTKIINEDGKTEVKTCRSGLDFCAVLFTAPVDEIDRFLKKQGLEYLNIAEAGDCRSSPDSVVQLYGFPQYVQNSPLRILPGIELKVTPGNIPDNSYTLNTCPGASGSPINKKNGKVKAIHINGQDKKRGDLGNWGISFDIIREELENLKMSERKAVIKDADMSEEMQQDAVDCATQSLEKYNIEKDIAAYIKKEFDKKYNPTWQVIVGRNFGSYVTHETHHFIYFHLGQVDILLFKSR